MDDLSTRLQTAVGDAYRIERELGGGGMSRLFLATEASLRRQVVLKVLPPELASEVSIARFRQEIELAAHLQHPNILPVLSAGSSGNLLFYVMPFVAGESLRHRLAREGQLPVRDAVRILHETADALAHAHAKGVIHRDIKPENILLLGEHAVLTDFGVARALVASRSDDRLTEPGFALGTPAYMSPEQAAGERNVDARADVYALAVVGYEMFAGDLPFTGPSAQSLIVAHLTATPKPLGDVRPDTPAAVADAIGRALLKDPNERLGSAADFRDAIATSTPAVHRAWWTRRRSAAAGVLALVGIGISAVVFAPSRRVTGPDGDVVAIAPFEVLDPKLELWREGIVDVLSRNLDGAGALRTVPPTLTIRRWSGHADPTAAVELGRRTNAGLVVFGTVTSEGQDSARVTASIVDTRSAHVLAEIEERDASDRFNRLVDSLTIALLRKVGRDAGALARLQSTGTRSLTALKGFLRGEQFYRRTAWDSALAAYRQAVAEDSNFALAWRRMATVIGWRVFGGDSLERVYAERASSRNRGLAPRESLLIVADSLTNALFMGSADTSWRLDHARLSATLGEALRRYPEDAEIWYQLGDASVHAPWIGRTTDEQTLDFFDRAITLDSTMGQSYIHAVGLALQLGHVEQAQRYVRAYLALSPTDVHASAFRIVDLALRSPREAAAVIDTASADVLANAALSAGAWPDSAEVGVRIGRALVASRRSATPIYNERWFRSLFLIAALTARGHLRESYRVAAAAGMGEMIGGFQAPLGIVDPDTARAVRERVLRNPSLREGPTPAPLGFNLQVLNAPPGWAFARDTASLAAFAHVMDSLVPLNPASMKPWLWYGAGAARAYLALVRGDSADALRRFLALPDTVCPCMYDQIVTAQLLSARARYQEAERVLARQASSFFPVPLWRLQRARVLEQLGRRDDALREYAYVVDAWRYADAELQPYVEEARAALRRLRRG